MKVIALILLFALPASSQDWMTQLSNQVAAVKARPGWVEPGPVQTLPLLATNDTSSGSLRVIEAASPAAASWLRQAYSPERWNGVLWYLETPRGWLLPVDKLNGVAPGMRLPLTGLLPKDYPKEKMPSLPESFPEYAPFAEKPVVIFAVRGWFSEEAQTNQHTIDAWRTYSSSQTAISVKLGRWIYAEPVIPSSSSLSKLGI